MRYLPMIVAAGLLSAGLLPVPARPTPSPRSRLIVPLSRTRWSRRRATITVVVMAIGLITAMATEGPITAMGTDGPIMVMDMGVAGVLSTTPGHRSLIFGFNKSRFCHGRGAVGRRNDRGAERGAKSQIASEALVNSRVRFDRPGCRYRLDNRDASLNHHRKDLEKTKMS